MAVKAQAPPEKVRAKLERSEQDLRRALEKLGASEFEVVALTMDAHRGLAALAYAQEKGVGHPISYAIKIFDSPDWQPANEKPGRATNQSVHVQCSTCGGDRFVVHRTRSIRPGADLIEEWKVCPSCNASADAGFYRADGSRFVPAK